jgi:hypothetical protein
MQLLTILYAALAAFAIGVEASPIRHSEPDAAKHSPQTLGHDNSTASLKDHGKGFKPVSPPPKVISARTDDDNFSMGGTVERAFDVISPPPKILPPRSDDEKFSMGGVLFPPSLRLSNNGTGAAIHARKDGFLTITPPPKTAAAAPAVGARAGTFDSISPPPKTRPSDSKLERRVDVRASGFIGNLVKKWTGRRQTTTTTSGNSSSSELTSYQQNGPSTYGTADMETLPKYYGGGSETPWGGVTTSNANPYKSCPLTGATRSYDFTVAECDIRPDGVLTKKAVCVNGQYPGPLIEANYGDVIRVKVTNKLRDEGTSMHWHGAIFQFS